MIAVNSQLQCWCKMSGCCFMAPIVAIWTDRFFWYFWQRFSWFLICPGACWLVFIAGLYLWHPSWCYLHRHHTAIAATLPARLLRMYGLPKLCTPMSCMLLACCCC